jgi:hypothetical protein
MSFYFRPKQLSISAPAVSVLRANIDTFHKNGFNFTFDETSLLTVYNFKLSQFFQDNNVSMTAAPTINGIMFDTNGVCVY